MQTFMIRKRWGKEIRKEKKRPLPTLQREEGRKKNSDISQSGLKMGNQEGEEWNIISSDLKRKSFVGVIFTR